jgi:hypothetical protein
MPLKIWILCSSSSKTQSIFHHDSKHSNFYYVFVDKIRKKEYFIYSLFFNIKILFLHFTIDFLSIQDFQLIYESILCVEEGLTYYVELFHLITH